MKEKYVPLKRNKWGNRTLNALDSVKNRVLKRDKHKCVDCSSKVEVTYHLIPIWANRERVNDITNLVSLCKDCHLKRHYVFD